MKKFMLINLLIAWGIVSFAQGIYNNGARIVSTSGSYWVIDNDDFTLTSSNATTPTQFYNLVITDDASLTLGSASTPAYLTVSDGLSITSPASITIPSGSTGTSSLIAGTVSGTGNFTVNRYITGGSLDWHLLSSPVASQEISGDFTPELYAYDFYLYNEPTNEWINRKNLNGGGGNAPYFDVVNGDLLFTPGRGYLVAYNENNPTKSFVGSINQGTISQALTVDGTSNRQGANLLGNPFPSSIDWKASSGWTRTMLRNDAQSGTGYSMYIWNETANNYGTFISNGDDGSGTNSVTRYIPPMQGFFVVAESAGSFQMTEAICAHESISSWLKNETVSPDIIKIKVSNSNYGADEVVLQNDPINQGGAKKWFSFVASAPSLWIKHVDKNYSILMDAIVPEENEYPMAFKAGAEAQYTLDASFDDNAFANLILEDKKLHTYHNLLQSNTYSFFSSPQDDPDRFILRFSAVGINEMTALNNPIHAYSLEDGIVITNNNQLKGTIKILNTLGQQMDHFLLDGNNSQRLSISLSPGIYIIVAEIEGGNTYTQKLLSKQH